MHLARVLKARRFAVAESEYPFTGGSGDRLRAAALLEASITTFDTADAYATGRAETILGVLLAGERPWSLEILTKPTGLGAEVVIGRL